MVTEILTLTAIVFHNISISHYSLCWYPVCNRCWYRKYCCCCCCRWWRWQLRWCGHSWCWWLSTGGALLSIQYFHWEIAPKHSRIMGFPGWKGSQRPLSPAFSMWCLNTFKLVFHPLFQHLPAGAFSNSLPLMFFLSNSFLTWKKGLIMPRRKDCGRRQRSCMSKTRQKCRQSFPSPSSLSLPWELLVSSLDGSTC